MNISIRQRYEKHYIGKVGTFLNEVGEIDATGMPEVHLPLWGNNYETTALKIAFIGRDTRYWGSMTSFRDAAKLNLQDAIFRSEGEFRELPFTSWTNNFGTTFWDTVMQLLAVFHDLPDWKQLKRRERDDILQSFVWAETNAVEMWDASPSIEGASVEAWRQFKTASECHLDSFSAVLNIFHPKIAIVMNWTVRDEYWDLPLQWIRIGDHVDYAFDASHATHVFHTAHPTWLRGGKRGETFETIIRQWKLVQTRN